MKLLSLEQATLIHKVASAACRMYLKGGFGRIENESHVRLYSAGRYALTVAMADDAVFHWPDLIGAWTFGICMDIRLMNRNLHDLYDIRAIVDASALRDDEKSAVHVAIDKFDGSTLKRYEQYSKQPQVMPYLIDRAVTIHGNQCRKDGVTPFVVHPYRVAMWSALLCDGAVLPPVVGLAHDFEEDCSDENRHVLDLVKATVTDELGDGVWYNVMALTKDMSLKRNARVVDAAERAREAGDVAIACKMCDIFDNLLDLDALSDKFANVFVKERAYLIDTLLNLEDPTMWSCGSPVKFRWMSGLIDAAIANATATHIPHS